MDRVYLIGNGYVCNFITTKFNGKYEFVGICRSEKRNCAQNHTIDIANDNGKLKNIIDQAGNVVYLAPPQNEGLNDQVLSKFLSSVKKNIIKKIIYISTSGVYGDRNDALVSESDKILPRTERAHRRADAEEQIKNSGIKYTILRVPGIYGRGRLPLKRVNERLPLIKLEYCKHTNLINSKDLANVIIQTLSNKNTDNIIMNVSDGTPIKTTRYYLHIYDQLHIQYPKFINYDEAYKIYDSKRMSFINESRILDVSLMNKIFPNIIEYRDIKDGIKDSLK
jgi:nucleoside-diphosphate-sugar epimerase